MNTNILFVDDEEHLIHGLKRMLFTMRKVWNQFYALSGKEALEILEHNRIDIIISDIRMPNMNGTELLSIVKEKYPQTVRIILSGHSDDEMALRSTACVHQFWAKPLDSNEMKIKLERTVKLRRHILNSNLESLIKGIGNLPALPSIYLELERKLKEQNISLSEIAGIVSKDIAISAKLMQISNSAFFSISTPITNVKHAITLVGVNILRSLILYFKVFPNESVYNQKKVFIEELWNHSLSVAGSAARITRQYSSDKSMIDFSYISGILHDIGKVIMLKLEGYPENVFELSAKENIDFTTAEEKIYGATHAGVGAYLLGLWGLPDEITEAVLFHHQPYDSWDKKFSSFSSFYIANNIANSNIKDEEISDKFTTYPELVTYFENFISEKQNGTNIIS